ncbi:hypothetical protein [Microbispora sp. KK1-11]|uniref:hypothetical protein n=1 Tax=Microbispora sp. KK1-11 TaxID=2053005 RepID=UPI001157C0A3|nr:hypothetical protein [Microbispora sp. KK1-11]TQS29103.1 hypothetical protein FLW16_12215 [Microbispora sp. KK1-11]
MRTVYVVTTAPSSRAQRARFLALVALARIVIWLAFLGHLVTLAVGALDALITAAIGTRRVGFLSHQLADAARETWEWTP